jgi:putative IMPACT (imprinted ancient) family translation regulator
MELTVDYSYYERVNNLLADHGARVQNADFGAAVTLAYTMEETRLPAFAAALTELSGGKYAPTQTGSLFAPV